MRVQCDRDGLIEVTRCGDAFAALEEWIEDGVTEMRLWFLSDFTPWEQCDEDYRSVVSKENHEAAGTDPWIIGDMESWSVREQAETAVTDPEYSWIVVGAKNEDDMDMILNGPASRDEPEFQRWAGLILRNIEFVFQSLASQLAAGERPRLVTEALPDQTDCVIEFKGPSEAR